MGNRVQHSPDYTIPVPGRWFRSRLAELQAVMRTPPAHGDRPYQRQSYTFQLRAVNRAGPGQASDSVEATPMGRQTNPWVSGQRRTPTP